jgi:SAM-dependent methyltransferase
MLHQIERDTKQDHSSQDYWAQTRANIITNWVAEHNPDSVLDVGCGSGYVTRAINDALPNATVRGIDTNKDSINLAQSYDSDVEFTVYDAFELDEYNEEFDVVVFADVLEHFTIPEALLRQARCVLAAGGRVVVSVPAFGWLWGPHDIANNHETRYSKELLTEVAGSGGYRVTRSRYTNLVPLLPYFLYQRVLQKPIPSGARGGHNRVVELVKEWLIGVESRVRVPVGVTLLGQLHATDS